MSTDTDSGSVQRFWPWRLAICCCCGWFDCKCDEGAEGRKASPVSESGASSSSEDTLSLPSLAASEIPALGGQGQYLNSKKHFRHFIYIVSFHWNLQRRKTRFFVFANSTCVKLILEMALELCWFDIFIVQYNKSISKHTDFKRTQHKEIKDHTLPQSVVFQLLSK